ncbi:MAG: hypothetical protein GXX85_14505 [Ignavibacteria bacterium]|nr:hypothetical protein [Ignavibacteria bacterium]
MKLIKKIETTTGIEYIGEEETTPEHNQLDGLQGGTTDEYYHLTATEQSNLHTHTNKDILDGIIDTGDGDEFLADDGTYKTIDAGLEYFDENRNNSSPNAAVPAHQLIVKGDETSIDLVLSSKGAGAIIAQIPDGTATGGNKRGNNAVDFQKKRNNANQVATSLGSGVIAGANNRVGTSTSDTANYSFIGAGINNYIAGSLIGKTGQFIGAGSGNACDVKCSGIMAGETNTIHTSDYGGSCAIAAGKSNYINVPSNNGKGYMAIVAGESNWCGQTHSIIGAGLGNYIDGEYAGILSGSYGKVEFYGQQAHASGRFTALGDAQRSDYVLRGNTLTTNYYRLYLDGSSALIDLSQTGAYSTWQCKLKVTGIRKLTGSIDHYNSEHNFMIYRENSTPVIADLTEIHTHQVVGSSVATGVSITTNSLAIDIATTENNWQFVAHLETVETFSSSLV